VKPPLVVIVGPTGVGKTAVAVRLAARIPIEAVNADSRQVYRGMDVGTGKPTAAEQAALRHHVIDVVNPDEAYHVQRFRVDALRALGEIRGRGHLPVVVGGTGLYVRGLLKGLHAAPPATPALRAELETLAEERGTPALHARLSELDPAAAGRLHANDRVRLIRALEIAMVGAEVGGEGQGAPTDWKTAVPPFRLLMVGLRQPREILYRRLADRVHGMIARGMMDEVKRLREAGFSPSLPSMAGIGYRQLAAALDGQLTTDEAIRLMIRDTRRYAKRQLTWFARDPEIRWLDVNAAAHGARLDVNSAANAAELVNAAADEVFDLIAKEGLIE
jgi:tRNA dimethylallyltransferase